jgi:hypothetical protein
MRQVRVLMLMLPAAPVAALAHHGWGNASKLIVVEGPIEALSYVNPHATLTV